MYNKLKSKLKAFAQNKHVQAIGIVLGGLLLVIAAMVFFFTKPVEFLLTCMLACILWVLYMAYLGVHRKLTENERKRNW